MTIVFVAVWRSDAVDRTRFASPYSRVKAFSEEDRVPPNYSYNFKILLSYLQIATSLMAYVSLSWPTAFRRFINYFSFVNLQFIPSTLR